MASLFGLLLLDDSSVCFALEVVQGGRFAMLYAPCECRVRQRLGDISADGRTGLSCSLYGVELLGIQALRCTSRLHETDKAVSPSQLVGPDNFASKGDDQRSLRVIRRFT